MLVTWFVKFDIWLGLGDFGIRSFCVLGVGVSMFTGLCVLFDYCFGSLFLGLYVGYCTSVVAGLLMCLLTFTLLICGVCLDVSWSYVFGVCCFDVRILDMGFTVGWWVLLIDFITLIVLRIVVGFVMCVVLLSSS